MLLNQALPELRDHFASDPAGESDRAPPPRLICRCIAASVALDFGLAAEDLFRTKTRTSRLALPRQVAMYFAHVGFGLAFDVVGRQFGRDRTTVAHACRVVEDARDDRWFDCRIAALDSTIRSAIAAAGDRR